MSGLHADCHRVVRRRHAYSHADSDAYFHTDSDAYSDGQTYPNAEAAADTAPASNSGTAPVGLGIFDDRCFADA